MVQRIPEIIHDGANKGNRRVTRGGICDALLMRKDPILWPSSLSLAARQGAGWVVKDFEGPLLLGQRFQLIFLWQCGHKMPILSLGGG